MTFKMSAYTPACLAWHILFSLGGFIHFEEWQFKGCQFVMARYCAACMTSWVPSRQLQRAVFQRECVTDVGRGNKHKAVLSWLTWRYWPHQKVKRIWIYNREMFEFHEIFPTWSLLKLICGVKWDLLSGTICRNVNKAALRFTSLDLPFQL